MHDKDIIVRVYKLVGVAISLQMTSQTSVNLRKVVVLKDTDLESRPAPIQKHEDVMPDLRQRKYGYCKQLETVVGHLLQQIDVEFEMPLVFHQLSHNMSQVKNGVGDQAEQLQHKTLPLLGEVNVLLCFHVPEQTYARHERVDD